MYIWNHTHQQKLHFKIEGTLQKWKISKMGFPFLFLRSSTFCSKGPSNFGFFYLGQGARFFFFFWLLLLLHVWWEKIYILFFFCCILGTGLLRLYGPQIDGPWAQKIQEEWKRCLGYCARKINKMLIYIFCWALKLFIKSGKDGTKNPYRGWDFKKQ